MADEVVERLRNLVQRKRDDLARFDDERKKIAAEVKELEFVLGTEIKLGKNLTGIWDEDLDNQLLSFIDQHPGTRQIDVSRQFGKAHGIVPGTVTYHIAMLRKEKKLKAKKQAGTTGVTLEVAA